MQGLAWMAGAAVLLILLLASWMLRQLWRDDLVWTHRSRWWVLLGFLSTSFLLQVSHAGLDSSAPRSVRERPMIFASSPRGSCDMCCGSPFRPAWWRVTSTIASRSAWWRKLRAIWPAFASAQRRSTPPSVKPWCWSSARVPAPTAGRSMATRGRLHLTCPLQRTLSASRMWSRLPRRPARPCRSSSHASRQNESKAPFLRSPRSSRSSRKPALHRVAIQPGIRQPLRHAHLSQRERGGRLELPQSLVL